MTGLRYGGAGAISGAAVLGLVMGCTPDPPRERETMAAATAPATTDPSVGVGLARPPRVVRVHHRGRKGCFVSWRERASGRDSDPLAIRCPREVVEHEAIRLTGRTCTRESPDPSRRGPVRCAFQLVKVQRALRTGEPGPWQLEAPR
ncbi:MAG: hypothetical protein AAF928_21135 [Myxococcota bacterium]